MCGRRLLWRESRSIAGDGGWNGFVINEREQQYVHMKSQPKMRNMQMARVRLMVRGGCLPVRGSIKEWNGNIMMISLCVGQKKQRYMCFLSVNIPWFTGY